MNILVTGGAGFIGSHCVDALLKRGHNVTVLDSFGPQRMKNLDKAKSLAKERRLKLKLVKSSFGSLRHWKTIPRHDVLLRLWPMDFFDAESSPARWEQGFQESIEHIQHLIGWLIKKKVRALVSVNRAETLYGEISSNAPLDERTSLNPVLPMGVASAFFELYLSAFCQAQFKSGRWSTEAQSKNFFSWASLRCCELFGPRQDLKKDLSLVPRLIDHLSKGKSPSLKADGQNSSTYLYVDDAVTAIVDAVEKVSQVSMAESFNLASASEMRDIEIFESTKRLMHEMGTDPEAPKALQAALKVSRCELLAPRVGEPRRRLFDTNKIELFLGWRPRVRFEEGLRSTLEEIFSFRQN